MDSERTTVGLVESLRNIPVKSGRAGEELDARGEARLILMGFQNDPVLVQRWTGVKTTARSQPGLFRGPIIFKN